MKAGKGREKRGRGSIQAPLFPTSNPGLGSVSGAVMSVELSSVCLLKRPTQNDSNVFD